MSVRTLTIGAFAAIFDGDGRVLCVRQNYGDRLWTTPGGRLENDETPVAAVVREVKEETGLDVKPSSFAGVFWKSYAFDLVFSFICEIEGDNPLQVALDEIADCAYFAPGCLPSPMSLNTSVRIREALRIRAIGTSANLAIFSSPDDFEFI